MSSHLIILNLDDLLNMRLKLQIPIKLLSMEQTHKTLMIYSKLRISLKAYIKNNIIEEYIVDKEITDEHRTYHDIIYNVGADIKIVIPLFKYATNDIDP